MADVTVKIFKGNTEVASELIASPITAAEAKSHLTDTDAEWVGKLTKPNSSTGAAGLEVSKPLTELWRAMKKAEIGEDGILRLPPTVLFGLDRYKGQSDGKTVVLEAASLQFRVLFKGDVAYRGSATEWFSDELEFRDTYYLVDAASPKHVPARTILTSRPNRKIFKDYEAMGGAKAWFLEVWSLHKLLAARTIYELEELEVMILFDKWNGIARVMANRIKKDVDALAAAPGGTSFLAENALQKFGHAQLISGGCFEVLDLSTGDRCWMSFPRCSEVRVLYDGVKLDSVDDSIYWKLHSQKFLSIDSLKQPNLLFQMTWKEQHPIDVDGAENALEAIAGEEAKLYFLVPAHSFDRFKKQNFVMGKGQPTAVDRARIEALQAKIAQYALKMNTRRVMRTTSACCMRRLPRYQIVRQMAISHGRL
ncbi:hypothetical protein COCOBI_04-0110 [Coccomyxa sp. Obi]|nr:hypothetical protein COCOBI_04-0110 [Coccomyxa sp. Obi]